MGLDQLKVIKPSRVWLLGTYIPNLIIESNQDLFIASGIKGFGAEPADEGQAQQR